MERRTIIIIAAVVVILIFAYVFLSGSGKKTGEQGSKVNGTTSMTVPPYITTYNSIQTKNMTNITGVNIKLLYTGPNVSRGIQCVGVSRAYTLQNRAQLKAGVNVSFYFYISSPNCNFTITKIGIDNNGFSIIDVQPPTPYQLPPQSEIQETVTVKTPSYNFTGPLSITVYAK